MGKEEMLKDLGLRIYNNKMITKEVNGEQINQDEKEIREICNRTFGSGSPSPENLHLFNQFLVETAEIIAKPRVDGVLGLLADVDTVPAGAVKMYKIPKTTEAKFLFTAKGTGVDLVRLSPGETNRPAVPQSMTYGGYYEMTTFRADPIKAFRDAVDTLANAKVEYYFDKVFELVDVALANGDIPQNNQKVGSNLALADFQKVEQTMIRLTNGRPVLVGDMSLINHFANLIPTTQKDLLTDEIKDMLREELMPTKISKTIAVNMPNTWIDEKNSKVRFDHKTGFVFPGAIAGKKPFAITEFGTKRQYSELDPVTEQVKLKIVFESDVTLLNGRYFGVIKDDSVTV
jgi:hypothetical protein